MESTQQLLSDLIALPSVNPAFVPEGDVYAGERRVAEFIAALASRAGLEVEFQPVLPGRSNILARLAPSGKARRRVILAPHLDTVTLADESQLVPRKKHGRLYGRGACDTKGSVAAMLSAMTDLAGGSRRPSSTEILFAGLVDEENGQSGSRALVASGMQAEFALVGEPTRLKVVTAHKGNQWLELETRGKAAHGSTPDLGRNAVHQMARVVDLLETTYASQLKRRRHPLLGNPTVNVGSIQGGTQPNIVPDCCRIRVDRRTLPGETEGSVRREIRSLLRHHSLRVKLTNTKTAPCLPLETDARLPLVRQLLRVAGQERPIGVDYFCDASVLAHSGIPSVVFGPGDIAQAHTADEWISLRSLERGRELIRRFLLSLP